ncbi:unnamed protein product (macronuclear) [Paramecium tetraurelia]|uniref:Protein kinase domain-containing protein n=1 Tax=Paramecium tetraurelia TaxID=5888 RepID=A0DIB8_PARTE|nr:uncharacterized protein GSPATT00017157001 [Paramecium tetraurelia]CAK82785.1 unnamed protein product [Paramecium tetraurelia]|eukprot:XP_001450182.1 hypothetical protein (macronuclear) [Paramecium tetraurelia strain d4-2]
MNYPYQPYRPYQRVPNTSVHNPNIMSYVDSVLSKSRNNYASVQLDPQPKYQTYQTNTIKSNTDLKITTNSPLILSQKSMVIQPTLKSKQEYQSPKKVESLSFQSEIPLVIPLIPLMANVREEYSKKQVSTPVSQTSSPIKKLEKPKEKYKNFAIIKKLGDGQYSEVFLAMHIQTGFLVALKVIQKSQIIKENMQAQLAWEIKIQYLLEHPNITKLYTFFQTPTEIVLVLEYCSHGQLTALQQIQPVKKFQERIAAQYIQQITLALMYIHNQDVIHRDIKPDNILLSFGQVKLADFSFCVYSPDEERQTQCGTIIYASPQILEGETYDKKSDIWGLGVLTYELCFGKPPWKENQQELMKTACFMIPYTASRDLKDFIENLMKPSFQRSIYCTTSLESCLASKNCIKCTQLYTKQ